MVGKLDHFLDDFLDDGGEIKIIKKHLKMKKTKINNKNKNKHTLIYNIIFTQHTFLNTNHIEKHLKNLNSPQSHIESHNSQMDSE